METPTDTTLAEQEADLEAGYLGSSTEATPPPTPEVPAEAAPPAAAEPAPAPEYVQLTKAEHAHLLQRVEQIEALKQQMEHGISSVFGKVGGVERTLKQLQAQAATGQPVQVSDDDFQELKEEFPELAKVLLAGQNRVLAKMTGTARPDDELVQRVVAERVESRAQELAQRSSQDIMDMMQPDWRTTVSSPDFVAWLADQPQDYQTKIQQTWKPAEVHQALSAFTAHRAAQRPAPPATNKQAEQRKQRLAAAVTPRGDAGTLSQPSEEDEMVAGYNQAMTR